MNKTEDLGPDDFDCAATRINLNTIAEEERGSEREVERITAKNMK